MSPGDRRLTKNARTRGQRRKEGEREDKGEEADIQNLPRYLED